MINQGDEEETTTTVALLNQIKPNTKFDTGKFFQEPTSLKNLNFPAKKSVHFLPFEQKMCYKRTRSLRVFSPNYLFKQHQQKTHPEKNLAEILNYLKY